MVKEKEVWAKFKKTWPWHCERQEPGGGFDSGKPDVLLQDFYGTAGLVELKAPDRWRLRPSQWIWHERWVQLNRGRSCIVTCEIYDGETKPTWYISSVTYEMIKERKLGKMEVLHRNIVVEICKCLGLRTK